MSVWCMYRWRVCNVTVITLISLSCISVISLRYVSDLWYFSDEPVLYIYRWLATRVPFYVSGMILYHVSMMRVWRRWWVYDVSVIKSVINDVTGTYRWSLRVVGADGQGPVALDWGRFLYNIEGRLCPLLSIDFISGRQYKLTVTFKHNLRQDMILIVE